MQKPSKPTAYTENNSTKECWKNSLYKNFFSDRKKLFDGKNYPVVGKGLQLSDPTIKFGSGAYTFKTSDVVDKANWKAGKREFQARYKKDAKKFDISVKEELTDGIVGLVKYENRGDANKPHYVVGLDFSNKGLKANAKFNPFTGFFKASGIYDAGQILPGATIGGDLKTVLPASGAPQFNVGLLYKSQFGTTGAAFNHDGLITVNHVLQVDKNLSTGIEFVQPTKDAVPAANPLSLGASYKVDKDHEVKARLNKKGELSMALNKKFSPECDLTIGACVDASKPDGLFKPPSFGFKLNAKM